MHISSKGRVTIPIEIRKRFGFLPYTEVEFVMSSGEVSLRKRRGKGLRGKKLIEALRGKATLKMTTGEIMALTRGE